MQPVTPVDLTTMTTIEVLTLLASNAISQNEAKRLLALPED